MKNVIVALWVLSVSLVEASNAKNDLSHSTKEQGSLSQQCDLALFTASDLNPSTAGQALSDISSGLNKVLKTSYQFLNTLDHASLGLVSALLKTGYSLENMSPTQWNRARLGGQLLYQNQEYSATPLRGVSIRVRAGKDRVSVSTGTRGELFIPLYKLVKYDRIRLFPIVLERGTRYINMTEKPVEIEIESPFCKARTSLEKLPLSELSIVLLPKKEGA